MGLASPKSKGIGLSKGGKTKKTKAPPFDVKASLLRLDKRYDEITTYVAKKNLIEQEGIEETVLDDNGRDLVCTEYIVASRCRPVVADWVPVAQICVARDAAQAAVSEGSADIAMRAAISHYCRELSYTAAQGSRVFSSLPRSDIEYAVEPVDSFHKHVYEVVMEGKNEDVTNDNVMTKEQARAVLQLGPDSTVSEIKKAYRTQSFEWHPDRLVGKDNEDETNSRESAERYAQIKLAYETLTSGVRRGGDDNGYYASLGGRARTDFVGPVSLMSISAAKEILETKQIDSAIVRLEEDIVQTFVARSQASI